MRNKLLYSNVALAVLCTGSAMENAGNKNQALTACKAHITERYDEGLRTKLKRIRQRKGMTEVRMRVSVNGERFYATCAITSNGELTYSTDQEFAERAVTKK